MASFRLLIPVCLSLSTLALGAEPTVSGLLNRARSEVAHARFAQAERLADEAVEVADVPAEKVACYLLLGEIRLARGKTEQARQAFASALSHDPQARLHPDHASPVAVDLLERERSRLPCRVDITAEGPGTTILLDGQPMGPSPLSLEVTAGRHEVTAIDAEGRRQRRELEVAPGATVTLHFEQPAAPSPEVAEIPEGPPDTTFTSSPASGAGAKAWIPAAAGAALFVGGALSYAAALERYGRVDEGHPSIDSAQALQATAREGRTYEMIGLVGAGVGLAALGVAGAMWVFEDEAPAVAALPLPGGGALVTVGWSAGR